MSRTWPGACSAATFGKEDHRFIERRDPKHRPADAVPVEFVLLGYPVLDSPTLPGDGEADDGTRSSETGDEPGG